MVVRRALLALCCSAATMLTVVTAKEHRLGKRCDCRGDCLQYALHGRCSAEALVAAMDERRTDRDVQRNGCRALGGLACGPNPTNQAAIREAGGIGSVMTAMATFPTDSLVQSWCGGWALGYLAGDNPTNQAAIREAGGISSVTAAMAAFPTDRDLQRTYCDTLSNLAGDNPTNQAAIGEEGGIGSVTAAMATFPTDESTLWSCCFALYQLAEDNPVNQAAIVAAGGGELARAAMVAFPPGGVNSSLQLSCQAALDNLPGDSDPCFGVECVHGRCHSGVCKCDAGWSGSACAKGGLAAAGLLRVVILLIALWLAYHHRRRHRGTNLAVTQNKDDIEEALVTDDPMASRSVAADLDGECHPQHGR